MSHARYLDKWRNDALDRADKPWQAEMARVIHSVAARGGQVRVSVLAHRHSSATVDKLVRRRILREHWADGSIQVAPQLNRAEWE